MELVIVTVLVVIIIIIANIIHYWNISDYFLLILNLFVLFISIYMLLGLYRINFI